VLDQTFMRRSVDLFDITGTPGHVRARMAEHASPLQPDPAGPVDVDAVVHRLARQLAAVIARG
jgi:hypothetical protein